MSFNTPFFDRNMFKKNKKTNNLCSHLITKSSTLHCGSSWLTTDLWWVLSVDPPIRRKPQPWPTLSFGSGKKTCDWPRVTDRWTGITSNHLSINSHTLRCLRLSVHLGKGSPAMSYFCTFCCNGKNASLCYVHHVRLATCAFMNKISGANLLT